MHLGYLQTWRGSQTIPFFEKGSFPAVQADFQMNQPQSPVAHATVADKQRLTVREWHDALDRLKNSAVLKHREKLGLVDVKY